MSFGQSISTCFSKYATFKGRAARSEFWYFMLFIIIGSVVMGVVDSMLFEPKVMSSGSIMLAEGGMQNFSFAWQPQPITGLFMLVTFLPNLAVTVRRLHDTGKSGWMWWLVLIPLLGIILLIVWMATKGRDGDNDYGSDPLA